MADETDKTFVEVYSVTTGTKRRVPPHWLDVFPGRFRKTPLTRKQEEAAAVGIDADEAAAAAEADAVARVAANSTATPRDPGNVVAVDTDDPDSGASTERN